MRRHLVAAMAACLTVAGCSDDDATYRGDGYSLTVFVYDAETGAPIDSAALASGVVLYEGATKVQAVALDSARAGAVIFNDVPADYFFGNKVYPIMADVAGYQSFQGEVSYKTTNSGYVSGTSAGSRLEDDLFAQVGYIYLWPLGFHAPDYTFTVTYGGTPVPNAVVQLDADKYSEGRGNNQTDVILPAFDLVSNLSGTTDANGKVTFAGTTLMLGAEYGITVLPTSFAGVQLGYAGTSLQVGYSNVDSVLPLSAFNVGADTHGLYVTSVTPLADQIQVNGELTITFNIPVATTTAFATAFSVTPSVGITGGTLGTPSATASLSADGRTLTLAPNWTVDPTAITAGSSYEYDDGGALAIVVPAYPTDAISVFSLFLADSSTVAAHDTVTVSAP